MARQVRRISTARDGKRVIINVECSSEFDAELLLVEMAAEIDFGGRVLVDFAASDVKEPDGLQDRAK